MDNLRPKFDRRFHGPPDVDRGDGSGAPEGSPDVEGFANYQGDMVALQFARLRHPAIRRQMAELIKKNEDRRSVPRSLGPIEADIENRIAMLEKYPGKILDPHVIGDSDAELDFNDWKGWDSFTGGVPNPQQRSIVEAHEKGHKMRPYGGQFFREYFAPGFDFSKISFSPKDLLDHIAIGMPAMSMEKFTKGMLSYLSSGEEIAERMVQLKNYFGMRGQEKFTKRHLDHARYCYIYDTRMDNEMRHFFQAITPETEKEFLRLINESGV